MLEGKQIGRFTVEEILVLKEPSNKRRATGGIATVGNEYLETKSVSMKECVEPESTKAQKEEGAATGESVFTIEVSMIEGEVKEKERELGSERADALSRILSDAQMSST